MERASLVSSHMAVANTPERINPVEDRLLWDFVDCSLGDTHMWAECHGEGKTGKEGSNLLHGRWGREHRVLPVPTAPPPPFSSLIA
jgi:hypothetical protein